MNLVIIVSYLHTTICIFLFTQFSFMFQYTITYLNYKNKRNFKNKISKKSKMAIFYACNVYSNVLSYFNIF